MGGSVVTEDINITPKITTIKKQRFLNDAASAIRCSGDVRMHIQEEGDFSIKMYSPGVPTAKKMSKLSYQKIQINGSYNEKNIFTGVSFSKKEIKKSVKLKSFGEKQ